MKKRRTRRTYVRMYGFRPRFFFFVLVGLRVCNGRDCGCDLGRRFDSMPRASCLRNSGFRVPTCLLRDHGSLPGVSGVSLSLSLCEAWLC